MGIYLTSKCVQAVQWLPNDPEAREAFAEWIRDLNEWIREDDFWAYDDEADCVRMGTPGCQRGSSERRRELNGTVWIIYDGHKVVRLDPGDWLVCEADSVDWLYSEHDHDFRENYTPDNRRIADTETVDA